MLLGDLLRQMRAAAVAVDAAALAPDLHNAAKLEAVLRETRESLADYAVRALHRFSATASHEDWLDLMAALQRHDDPGRVCLARVLDWSLARDCRPPVHS